MGQVMPLRDSRARAERAFQLRAIGRSWRQIATELGYKSNGAAQTAVARHEQREGPEPVERTRRSLVESTRITTSVLFDRFAAAVSREDDQTVAMLNREIVRNRDQLAKLLGAYAPERSEVDVNVHSTTTAILAEARQRLLAIDGTIDAEIIE
jgi:hypothetical protein